MKSHTVLITGASGYLGSKLVREMSFDFNVIATYASTSERIKSLSEIDNICLHSGSVDKIFDNNKIDFIILCSTHYGGTGLESKVIEVNILQPVQILNLASKHGVRLILNVSTTLNKNTNSYSISKSHFEDWCFYYSNRFNLKVVNLKLEGFFGSNMSEKNFIMWLMKKIIRHEQNIPLTRGEQKRDYIYIEDLISAFKYILKNEASLSGYKNIDVGCGENISIRLIAETINKVYGSKATFDFGAVPYRPDELMESNCDTSYLRSLGWSPKYSFETGLIEMMKNQRYE